MSNEKQETIADIVADIRAQNQGLPEDGYALSPFTEGGTTDGKKY